MVGVWVGRDDNRSLGNVSGGTAPAKIWRAFTGPALAIDHRPTIMLPYRPPQRRQAAPRPSPFPEEWSDQREAIGELIDAASDLIEELSGR